MDSRFPLRAPRNDEKNPLGSTNLHDGQITSCFPKWLVQPLLQKYFPSPPTHFPEEIAEAARVRSWGKTGVNADIAEKMRLTRMYGPAVRCKRVRQLGRCGLASMYPASDWSVLCPGPSWISARIRAD